MPVRLGRLLRVLLSALVGWLLTLSGAVVFAALLQGVDAPAAFGLGRASLRFPVPVSPPSSLGQLSPVESASMPWVWRVTGGRGSASGTVVRWDGRDWLVTASHVAAYVPVQVWAPPPLRPSSLFGIDASGQHHDFAGGRASFWWDLAIYPLEGAHGGARELRAGMPAVGEAVRFTGYPSGARQPWAGSGSVVAVTAHANGGTAAVVASVAPEVGQSGGALTDTAGELVGIGVARTPYGVLAVGNGALAEAMSQWEQLPPLEPPLLALALAWLLAGAAAFALTVAVDRLLQRAALAAAVLRQSVTGRR